MQNGLCWWALLEIDYKYTNVYKDKKVALRKMGRIGVLQMYCF